MVLSYHFFNGIIIDLSYGTDFIVYTWKIEWFWTDPVFVDFITFFGKLSDALSSVRKALDEQGWPQGQEKGSGMQLV